MADCSLERAEVFLKNPHFSFMRQLRLFCPTSVQLGKSVIINYVLVGYIILILKNSVKYVNI